MLNVIPGLSFAAEKEAEERRQMESGELLACHVSNRHVSLIVTTSVRMHVVCPPEVLDLFAVQFMFPGQLVSVFHLECTVAVFGASINAQ